MNALDRFDEWESRLDGVLPRSGPTRRALDPAHPDRVELAQLYDRRTFEAIEVGGGEPPRTDRAGWRGGAATGAVLVGLVQGARDVLDDDDPEPVVEIEELRRDRNHQAVTVHLSWGNPAAGVAVVRRWLL